MEGFADGWLFITQTDTKGIDAEMLNNTTRFLNSIYFFSNFLIAAGFLIDKRAPQIANPVITTLFYLGLIYLEKRTSFKLNNYIRLLLIATLISHSFVGEYLRLYYTTAYFDKALHSFGSFSFALLAFELLNSFLVIFSSRPPVLIFILVSLAGVTIGTLFEIMEFSLDRLLGEKNQFGLIDTDLDLLFDLLGSLCAGIFLAVKNLYSGKFTRS